MDRAVQDEPLTQRVLDYFSLITPEWIDDPADLKFPQDPSGANPRGANLSGAKNNLLISQHRGKVLKSCQGMGDYVCCNYHTVSFISNCHMECTYCILQDYLQNNPIMTFYANVDRILREISETLARHPDVTHRVGTGELSDSLALDSITGLSQTLIPFAASQQNLILELKTKSDCIGNLADLDHQKKTVIAWSISPTRFAETEELKTASPEARILAARQVADWGYPVAFHLDPLLAFPGWEGAYQGLVTRLAHIFEDREIAWISLGSLRYTPELKKLVAARFPKSRILFEEMIPSRDGKMRYFIDIRTELYTTVKKMIEQAFPTTPNYLCMETSRVWQKVYQDAPPSQRVMEQHLQQRFAL